MLFDSQASGAPIKLELEWLPVSGTIKDETEEFNVSKAS